VLSDWGILSPSGAVGLGATYTFTAAPKDQLDDSMSGIQWQVANGFGSFISGSTYQAPSTSGVADILVTLGDSSTHMLITVGSGISAAAPTGVQVSPSSGGPITITWTPITGLTYSVERATDADFAGGLVTLTPTPGAGTLTDTDVKPSTRYFYRVIATTSGGSSDPSATVSASTASQAPNIGPDLDVSYSGSDVTFTGTITNDGYGRWTPSGFQVAITGGASPVYASFTLLGGATFLDPGQSAGFQFTVDASAISGLGGIGVQMSNGNGVTFFGDISNIHVAPAPTLRATAGEGSITLDWDSVAGAREYVVYDMTSVTPIFAGAGTSFEVEGLQPNEVHSYAIKAIIGNSESRLSETLTYGSLPESIMPAGGYTVDYPNPVAVDLSFDSCFATEELTLYRSSTNPSTSLDDWDPVEGVTFSPTLLDQWRYTCLDTGCEEGQTYYYIVLVTTEYGQSPIDLSQVLTVAPPNEEDPEDPPALTAEHSDDGITLDWDPFGDATYYEILRNNQQFATTMEPGFVDHWFTSGTSYTYKVEAVHVGADPLHGGGTRRTATEEAVVPAIERQFPDFPSPVVNITTSTQSRVYVVVGGYCDYQISLPGPGTFTLTSLSYDDSMVQYEGSVVRQDTWSLDFGFTGLSCDEDGEETNFTFGGTFCPYGGVPSSIGGGGTIKVMPNATLSVADPVESYGGLDAAGLPHCFEGLNIDGILGTPDDLEPGDSQATAAHLYAVTITMPSWVDISKATIESANGSTIPWYSWVNPPAHPGGEWTGSGQGFVGPWLWTSTNPSVATAFLPSLEYPATDLQLKLTGFTLREVVPVGG